MRNLLSPRFMLLLTALALVAFTSDPEAKKYTLQLNLEEGQTYRLESTTDQEINQVIMGMENVVEQTMGFTYAYDVTSASSEAYDISVTYDEILYRQSAQGMEVTYDSRDEETDVPLQAQSFANLVGQSFEMTVTPAGSVTEVRGMDELIEAMIGEMDMPGVSADQIRQQLKTQFSDESMQSSMEQTMAIYPDGPVKKGDSWTREMSISTVMTMQVVNTYTLDKVEGGKAYVSVEGTTSTGDEGNSTEMMGMSMTFNMEGTQSGSLVIDMETGMTITSTIDQTITGDVSATGGQMGSQTLEFPMSIDSKSTVNLLED